MATVLVVEDNAELAMLVRDNLEVEGHTTLIAHDGREGLECARTRNPDLVILDLTLPIIDGTQVLSALRREGFTRPVLVLSARVDEVDRLLGFRLGADDYVTKPFSVLELMARVGAMIRRGQSLDAARGTPSAQMSHVVVRFADVEVDIGARTVRRGDADVPIAPRAFDLLVALIDAHGNVVSRRELLERVWGNAHDETSRTVDSHVAELRRKLERDAANPAHILTVRKTGYRLRL